jgi:hypothetical protein
VHLDAVRPLEVRLLPAAESAADEPLRREAA